MKFITICDRTGIVETELFASEYLRYGLQAIRYPMIQVIGKVLPLANGKGFSFELSRVVAAIK